MKRLTAFKNKKIIIGGSLAGFINGLLGSGGGMIAVPALEKSGLDAKQAHSGSIAVILPLSLFSACMYIGGGRVEISDALPYVPAGIIGSFCGAWLMKKISSDLLRRIFGGFAIWAGVRMLMR
ncbi:MAG: sulfite exporter TauE/SafE family protein [Acutalibacteraceae bacterium]